MISGNSNDNAITNRSSHYLQIQISRLAWKSRGVPETADLPHHQSAQSELRIQPRPATRTERKDFFGNRLCFFTIQEPHRELVSRREAK
jgi:transglutaminase-like putative cysteine protease